MAPVAPNVVVPAARHALRQLVGHLVVDARPAQLTRTLKALRSAGVRLNLNLLGEAVLGDREAASRLEGTMALLAREDVDYVSIKISAVVNQLDLWAHKATVDEVVEQRCRCTTWLRTPRSRSSSTSTWRNITTLI